MGVRPLVFSRLQMLHRVPWNWVNNRGAILRGRRFSRSCDAGFISCEKFLKKKYDRMKFKLELGVVLIGNEGASNI